MALVINDAFAQALAKECFWEMLSTMGTHFSDKDFAAYLMDQVRGSKISHSNDGIYVTSECERYRAVVQTIRHPHTVKHYSLYYLLPVFNKKNVLEIKESELGSTILKIWNARLAEDRKRFSAPREIVLIKGENFSEISVFEEETHTFLPEEYEWDWNERDELEGYVRSSGVLKFTWQPHGSRFTITTRVPENRLKLRIKRPPLLDREEVLTQLKFDPSWIEIVK